jgi:hypothetical protein
MPLCLCTEEVSMSDLLALGLALLLILLTAGLVRLCARL